MGCSVVLHCVVDCSSSMSAWQKLYLAQSTIDLLVRQPELKDDLFPDLAQVKVWYWSDKVSSQVPDAYHPVSVDALAEFLGSLVQAQLNAAQAPMPNDSGLVRVLLLSDGCGAMLPSPNLTDLIAQRVRMSVIGIGPDQDRYHLMQFSSCRMVYGVADFAQALSEVLAVPLLISGQIEADLAALAQVSDLNNAADEDEDEW